MRKILWVLIFLMFFSQTVSAQVVVDIQHRNYSTIRWEEIFTGYDHPPWFPIDIKVLENYSIYVIENPTRDLLNLEKREIIDFVNKGGTLFLLADYEDIRRFPIFMELIDELGIEISSRILINTPENESPMKFFNHFSFPIQYNNDNYDFVVRSVYPISPKGPVNNYFSPQGEFVGYEFLQNRLQNPNFFTNPNIGLDVSYGDGNFIFFSGIYNYNEEFNYFLQNIFEPYLKQDTKIRSLKNCLVFNQP